jgi:hypothetical protein
VTAAFSTPTEALDLLAPVRDVIDRLPVAGTNAIAAALAAYGRLADAIAAVPVVDPADAVGTHQHRRVYGLAPIQEEPK